jgi:hypothetical protein
LVVFFLLLMRGDSDVDVLEIPNKQTSSSLLYMPRGE